MGCIGKKASSMNEVKKKKDYLVPFPLIYRLGGNGGVICGLINRGRNGDNRYGGA